MTTSDGGGATVRDLTDEQCRDLRRHEDVFREGFDAGVKASWMAQHGHEHTDWAKEWFKSTSRRLIIAARDARGDG
jgi:hypothetical protein